MVARHTLLAVDALLAADPAAGDRMRAAVRDVLGSRSGEGMSTEAAAGLLGVHRATLYRMGVRRVAVGGRRRVEWLAADVMRRRKKGARKDGGVHE